ncbi:MAG: hypothetical protein LBK82_10425 [Planctomycetaceae bacterium]|nr:hypothetical protein [Planctomycetaceae bacterium]
MGDPFAEGSRRLSHNFAIIKLIHSRRVRQRDLLAKGRLPDNSADIITNFLLIRFIVSCFNENGIPEQVGLQVCNF